MPALKSFNPSTAVNLGTNTINIPTHGLIVGQGVLYSNGGGTSISGLVDGYKYYVIFVDINNIRLANTEVEARAGTAVDLLSSGSGTTHTLTTTNIYPNSAAYYDFFRKFRFIGTGIVSPEGYTIEADNVRDTLTIIGGDGIVFSNPNTGLNDTITINGPDYDLTSPTGVTNGASIRLENLGVEYQDVKLTSFRGIRIERVASNEIEFESFGVTETDTLHTVTSRGNLTSNDIIVNNLNVGRITSIPGIDGVINVSVTAGDAFNGDGTLDNPVVFSPDESQRTDASATVILYFTTPSPGTLSYVGVYLSSAALTTGYVRLERENPSTLIWEILDNQTGTTERTSVDIENIYAELYAGSVNYRLTFNWTGNTEYVNYRTRITFEVTPIAGDELLVTDTLTKDLTLGANGGTVTIRGTIQVIDLIETNGIRLSDNNIVGLNSNDDINIRPSGTGKLVVSNDVEIQGGDLLTNQTSFNLLNTTATTVNALGAATTINVGANTGTLTINNPTVVGTQSTQNLYNTAATTINFGGAATTVNIGAATGTTSIKNDLEVRGGDITTNQTSFNLLDGTATTIQAFGAATTLTFSTAGGITTVRGDVVINQDLQIKGGDLTTNALTFNLLNTDATTINAFGAASTINLRNLVITSSNTIDSNDSSGITFIPLVTFNTDAVVENNLTVFNDTFLNSGLRVSGSATITGPLTATGTIFGSPNVTVDSYTIFNSDIEIRGGDLNTNRTEFNLLNSTATRINAFGAGTIINIGSGSGTTTVNNNLTVTGNLIVNGTTTTLNTATLDVEDLNITVALGAPSAAAANGAGLTVAGASATLLYASANDSWNFNKLLTASSLQNTPIGTTTRAAGNFTSLDANGNVTLGDTDTDTITVGGSFVTGTQLKTAKTNSNTLSLAAYDVDGTAYVDLIRLTAANTPTLEIAPPRIFDTSRDHKYIFAVSELTADRTVTLPLLVGNDTFVFQDYQQTLTNKTLTSPDINGGTADDLTSLSIRDTSAAFDVIIAATSNPALAADRTLTINVENANRSLSLGGNIDIAGTLTTANSFTTSGNFALTLTTTALTSVTLPTTGILATLAGSESLTNKKLGSLTTNGIVTTSGSDGTLSVTATTGSGNVVLGTAPTMAGIIHGNASSTTDADATVDAATTTFYAYVQSASGTARTINISNLTAGRMIMLYLRNTNAATKVINITASTTTSGFAAVNMAISNGAASATSVTLAVTSGTALIRVFNANGVFGGGM